MQDGMAALFGAVVRGPEGDSPLCHVPRKKADTIPLARARP